MDSIRRISECPNCGANVLSVDPNDLVNNKCPYCGYELYNHSKEIYDERIEGVKKAKSKLIYVQIGIAVAAVLLVIAAIIYVTGRGAYRQSDQYFVDASEDITKQLQKAYAKEDWDKLYELVIDRCDESLSSPYYYSYRAAWELSFFVPIFDNCNASDDLEGMKDAYMQIRSEYKDREKLVKTNKDLTDIGGDEIYKFVPEIEEKLEKEYLRETEIMEKRDLLK